MKPTVSTKLQEHEAIEFYKLPICDVQKDRRNFEGYHQYEGIDPWEGDSEGTTDTDSETDVRTKKNQQRINKIESAKGYTRINSSKKTKAQRGK